MAAPMTDMLSKTLKKITTATDSPEEFLTTQKGHVRTFTTTLKTVYDTTKSTDVVVDDTDVLKQLIVTGFDDEQIWQQLELENDSAVSKLVSRVARLVTVKEKCSFKAAGTAGSKTSKKYGSKKSLKQSVESVEPLAGPEDDIDEEFNEEEEEEEDGEDNSSDDEDLENIKSGLEDVDPNDKFFDFTGDSDEDLNFDFGPLSKKGEVNDEIFGKDSGSGKKQSKKGKKEKTKKSVTFEEDTDSTNKKQTENKSTENSNKNQVENKSKGQGLRSDTRKKFKGSILDDKFFKLAELEEFLDREDRRETRRQGKQQQGAQATTEESDDEEDDDNEEAVDMFGQIESEDEDMHYADFFDPPEGEEVDQADSTPGGSSKRSNSSGEIGENDGDDDDDDDDGNDDDDDDEDEEKDVKSGNRDLLADSDSEGEDVQDILGGKAGEKSTFEKRQEKLKQRISQLEQSLLSQKAWQMMGEVSAGKRPDNSLLQENLQFEYMSRLAPEVTEETTKSLESIIIQRIKDKVFDDVERKVRQKETPYEYKKRVVLEQEKSKQSLGEIYEQEYLKQQQTEEEEEKEDKSHVEIKQMMTSLFLKLDALSNFHYTPKQAAPEVKIVTNQPSIAMEEVAPVAVSGDKLLAPQEVQEKQKGELKGQMEKTDADKLRERKKKKSDKRARQKERDRKQKLVEQLNPGLGNKHSKEKAMKRLERESKSERSGVKVIKEDKKQKSGLTSSKTFFTQLQDEVSTMIKSKQVAKRKAGARPVSDAKKLKL